MRFRIRTMLFVVAAVAVSLGAERTQRRWVYFGQEAASHAALQGRCERDLRVIKVELVREERTNSGGVRCGNARQLEKALRSLAASRADEAAHHARLKEE